jgi:hypothetical protein
MGAILGPVIGGALDDKFEFRLTNDILGFASLFLFLFYTVTNIRPKDFKLKKNNEQK